MDLQVRCVLLDKGGLPGDYTINTFAVISGSASLDDVNAAFISFYNDTPPGGSDPLSHYLSQVLSRTTNAMQIEDLEVNLATGVMTFAGGALFTLGAPGSASVPIPQECAVCSSFAASGGMGVNPQRRRGRVYVGPLNTFATDISSVDSSCRVSSEFREDLALATNELAATLVGLGAELCVWSRADAGMYPVTHGWVDNEFDTQRRRGLDPTNRTTWFL